MLIVSKISDKIWELQILCSSVKEESVLKKEPLYKKFKAKYDGKDIFEIADLLDRLVDKGFWQETVFWSQKFLSFRKGHKEDKVRAFYYLTLSYWALKNYEKAYEYGVKWLEIEKQYFCGDKWQNQSNNNHALVKVFHMKYLQDLIGNLFFCLKKL